MSNAILSLPLFYLPPISWWVYYYGATVIRKEPVKLLYPSSFLKHRYFHRCRVKGPMGAFLLSVPINHGTKRMGYYLQTTDHEDWRQYHLKVFQNYYHKAPFFEEFYFLFKKEIYKSNFLYEINKRLIWGICWLLDLPFPISIEEVSPQRLKFEWRYPLPFKMKLYPQFYGTFLPDLSIADLLMQEGMESRNYFRSVLFNSIPFS